MDNQPVIMIVHPDTTITSEVEKILGVSVIKARDGEEALFKHREHKPRVIITDLNLPRMSGYRLMTEIRESNGSPSPAYIIVTDKHSSRQLEWIMKFGSSERDYFPRGINPERLRERIDYHLSR